MDMKSGSGSIVKQALNSKGRIFLNPVYIVLESSKQVSVEIMFQVGDGGLGGGYPQCSAA